MATPLFLIVNSGSSSVKFAVYTGAHGEQLKLSGKLDGAQLKATTCDGVSLFSEKITLEDRDAAIKLLIDLLKSGDHLDGLAGVGYRIVHGGPLYSQPTRITKEVLEALRGISSFAPDHTPDQIAVIESIARLLPEIPPVASFDTAFHRAMPRRAQLYGLTQALADEGIVRYGFHGLSYAYIVGEMQSQAILPEKLIVAHLGNGASMAAILNGKSIDTSMGFTPTGGFLMSNRSGDLDPGIVLHLLREKKMTVDQVAQLVNKEGGLKGLSGISSDMQELEKQASSSKYAAEAIEVFCYQIQKFLGAYCAILGGLDALVFTGGIGENSALVREKVCQGLQALGVFLDPERNRSGEIIISKERSPVTVRVIKTNEESMIARNTAAVLSGSKTLHSSGGFSPA